MSDDAARARREAQRKLEESNALRREAHAVAQRLERNIHGDDFVALFAAAMGPRRGRRRR